MTALGVSLLVIGAIVIVVEAHVSSLGMLGGPGVVALGVGAVLAISGLGGGILLGLLSALVLTAAASAVLLVSVRKGLAVRRRRVRSGSEGLIGHIGTVQAWGGPAGKVVLDGALWRAERSLGNDDDRIPELHPGDPVVVERLHGLTLSVRPAEDWELVR